ncbi:fibronectin type III domain-containing protein [Candidatus Microgenomates bacterium]|nr:fibronectin type III domain-containing protein [Candidatus Microgenomates bacterium]
MALNFLPKERKIPTLIGIFVLLIGIGVTTYLTQTVPRFFLKAQPDISPQDVKITNVFPNSFTVSWITPGKPSTGYVTYGQGNSLESKGLDIRDKGLEALGQYIIHYAEVKNLQPQSTYLFKIISNNKTANNGAPYKVTTAPELTSPPTMDPIHGLVFAEDEKSPAKGIIFLTIGQSAILSTFINSSGNWLIPLNLLRTADFKNYSQIKENDSIEIFAQGEQKSSQAMVSLANSSPVPPIILGKNSDFRTASTASPTPSVTLPTLTEIPSGNLGLTTPATNAAVPGQPFFRGTGLPGQKLQIKVESPTTYSGQVTVDQNGNWSWQPPANLPPGQHTVTITSTDQSGNLMTIVRKFIILASGTQITEAATPSATPTSVPTSTPTPAPRATASPTAKPSPTLTPTPTPTPVPPGPTVKLSPTPITTSSAIPQSGDLLFTLILATGGFSFILLGFFLLRNYNYTLPG